MSKVKLSMICAETAVVSCLVLNSFWQLSMAEGVKNQDNTKQSSDSNIKAKPIQKGQISLKSFNNSREHLIPPPPPSEPSLLLSPGEPNLPFEYAYLNKGLLSDRLEVLVKQLSETKLNLEEKIAQQQASKEKSERFRELYKEGVVSRRELEEAEKEAFNSERDIQRYRADISELESKRSMISQSLKASTKQTEHKGVKLAKPKSGNLTSVHSRK